MYAGSGQRVGSRWFLVCTGSHAIDLIAASSYLERSAACKVVMHLHPLYEACLNASQGVLHCMQADQDGLWGRAANSKESPSARVCFLPGIV